MRALHTDLVPWSARWLDRMARGCALLGGCVLLCILLLTSASVLGRNLLQLGLVGDFELTGLACGVAVALFMPWCQLRRGHILVDFFTARASASTVAWLNRCGALLLALCMGGLAWRAALGGLNAYANASSSMLLGVPHWWVYAGIVPALALTALIGLHQAFWPLDLLSPSPSQTALP